MLQGQQSGLPGGGFFVDKWVGVWLSRLGEEKIDYSICLEICHAADLHSGDLVWLWSHGPRQDLKYAQAATLQTPVASCR